MSALAAAVVALFSGLLAWWWGRGLVADPEDPALPERLLAYRNRRTQLMTVSAVFLFLVTAHHAWWAVPSMLVATLAGSHAVRRVLFAESGSGFRQLSFSLRLFLGMAGFWVLLLAAPTLISAAAPARWPVAVGLVGLLLVWQVRAGELLLWLLKVQPLARPELEARIAAIVARAGVAAPRVYRVAPAGTRWANAFALPWVHGGQAVVLSETLLDALTLDEAAAVFAHELGHLEHYDRARVRRHAVVNRLAIVAATLGVPALAEHWPAISGALSFGWVLLVAVALSVRLGRQRAHEAASDRRAVALCGDAEALGRGLVKLHALARLPRRWALDFERAASHPSLAHRLQALGAGSGRLPPAAPGPLVVRGRKAGAFVLLDPDGVHRLDGVPEGTLPDPAVLRVRAARAESSAYGAFTELRVRAGLSGGAALIGSGRTGGSWSVPLSPDGVGAVQAALDGIDARLARGPSGALHHPVLPYALVLGTLAVGWTASGFVATLIPAIVLLVRHSPAPLLAFGAAVLASALHAIFASWHTGAATVVAAGWQAAEAGFGASALGLALLRIRAGETNRAGALAAGVGLGLVVVVGAIPLARSAAAGDLLALHEAAREASVITVGLLGLAALLATAPGAGRRTAAAVAMLAAALPLGLATDRFVDRFARDPLLADASGFETTTGVLRILHRTQVGVYASGLQLSPSGARYTVVGWGRERSSGRPSRPVRLVGSFTGGYRESPGTAAAFLSDDQLLVLAATGEASELRVVAAEAPDNAVWRRPLPALVSPELAIDPATGRWHVSGPDPAANALIVITGRVGGDAAEERRLPVPDGVDATDLAYVVAGRDTALALDVRWGASDHDSPSGSWLGGLWPSLVPTPRPGSDVWLLEPRGTQHLFTSALQPRCLPAGRAYLCLSRHGGRSWIWRVDAATGDRRALGRLQEPLWALGLDGAGRVAVKAGARLALLDLPGGRIRDFAPAEGEGPSDDLAVAPGRLARLSRHADGTHLTLYETR